VTGGLEIPGSHNQSSLSRLGDDQTFVVSDFNPDTCVSHLFTFTIDAAGKPSPPAPFSAVPQLPGHVDEMTSSADGKVMAFNRLDCTSSLQMEVMHLATGQVSRWDNNFNGGADLPTLNADGSVLSFIFDTDLNFTGEMAAAFTIPTDAPAGGLVARARQVPDLGGKSGAAVLSLTGDQLWIETHSDDPAQDPAALRLITTSTGAPVRTVTPIDPDHGLLLAIDAAGQHMLLLGGNPGPGHADVTEVDLSSGQALTWTITNPEMDGFLTSRAW
jgi:hypothetical protein